MSCSNERTEEIARHNTQVPILNKYEFALDRQVIQDSSISPLLVRKRPENSLELPPNLKLKVKAQKKGSAGSVATSPETKKRVRRPPADIAKETSKTQMTLSSSLYLRS